MKVWDCRFIGDDVFSGHAVQVFLQTMANRGNLNSIVFTCPASVLVQVWASAINVFFSVEQRWGDLRKDVPLFALTML